MARVRVQMRGTAEGEKMGGKWARLGHGRKRWCGSGPERKVSLICMERDATSQDGDPRGGHVVPSAPAPLCAQGPARGSFEGARTVAVALTAP